MPIKPARIYTLEPEIPLTRLYSLLSERTELTPATYEDKTFNLNTIVRGTNWIKEGKSFEGRLLFETLEVYPQLDGELQPVKRIHIVDFVFYEGSSYFIAFSNQYLADTAATKLNNMLGDVTTIFNIFIPGTVFDSFLSQNPYVSKQINWRELSIPGTEKARLAGNNPELSQDSRRYDQLGERSYIMVELINDGITITLSRKGLLGFVSAIERSEMLQFIIDRIFPLL